MTNDPYKPSNKKWKQSLKFFLGFFATIFIITATSTNSWAELLDKKSDNERISKFGIWNTCVKIANETDLTCENSHDANFIIYKDPSTGAIYANRGKVVDEICYEKRNVTFLTIVKINGTDQEVNKTELRNFRICELDYTFDKIELERVRVFSIMVCIISFVVTGIWLIGFFKPEVNGFTPAVLSVLIPLWYIIALASFTSTYNERFDLVTFQYSWSFILACIAAILCIFQTLFAFYSAFTD